MIAIDASTQLYQFLVQVRSSGQGGGPAQLLMNEEGEITSHLQGFFTRSARLLENGIKPVFVFDGKPPTMKGGELAIPTLPAYRLGDLAKAMKLQMEITGLPSWEKRHEGMCDGNTSDVARRMCVEELRDELGRI